MTLEQCMEALSVCHDLAPSTRESARKVARDVIDEYMLAVTGDVAVRQAAIDSLRKAFDNRFSGQEDAARIRDYLGRIDRDIRREAGR